MTVTVTWEGVDELLRTLSGAPDVTLRAVGAGLYEEGERIMAIAKEHYVPVDLGILRDSGYVAPPQTDAEGVSVELGFGGAASAYAVVVHEDLSARHEVGEAKYLEKPLLLEAPQVVANVAEKARIALERLR